MGDCFYLLIKRRGHRRCSTKKAVFKDFAIFTGKRLCWTLFLIKLKALRPAALSKGTPTQAFFCEYWDILQNTYFGNHLQTVASVWETNSNAILKQAFGTQSHIHKVDFFANVVNGLKYGSVYTSETSMHFYPIQQNITLVKFPLGEFISQNFSKAILIGL